MYIHQLQGSYGADVSNIHMYDAISKEIIHRFTCPHVPYMNCSIGVPRHTLSRHNVYQQPNVTLAR
jgi:translation initiation factor eIF-2B subunit epsilon